MTDQPHPFVRVEPTRDGDQTMVAMGWRGYDGAESVAIRLPLTAFIGALFNELKIAPALLPTGVVAVDSGSLPEGTIASLLADGCVPQATISQLVRAMLEAIAAVGDPSDREDLESLVQELEQAARDVRHALNQMSAVP